MNQLIEKLQEYAHKYTSNYTTEKEAINVIKRSKKGILTDENGSKYVYLPFVKSKINHRR